MEPIVETPIGHVLQSFSGAVLRLLPFGFTHSTPHRPAPPHGLGPKARPPGRLQGGRGRPQRRRADLTCIQDTLPPVTLHLHPTFARGAALPRPPASLRARTLPEEAHAP